MGVEESSRVKFWTSRLAPTTSMNAVYALKQFMDWLKVNGGVFRDYTPDQLIQYQQEADNGHRYDLLDVIQAYASAKEGRLHTKRNALNRIRSFFLHNRAELPRDASFRLRSKTPMSRGDLTLEQLKRIVDSCNPTFRAVFLCMFQAGLGRAEFVYWNTHGLEQIRKDLATDARVFKIELPGRKSRLNAEGYYTFIGDDAVDALRTYWRTRPADAQAIFVNQFGQPISNYGVHGYFISHVYETGLGSRTHSRGHRTGKGIHELRDLFRSQFAKSPAKGEYAEFFMGHNIDPLGYNKSYRDVETYRAEYLRALPFLNIYSSGRPFHQVNEEEVETLREEVKALKQQVEARKESDQIMNDLFKRKDFKDFVKKTLREMESSS